MKIFSVCSRSFQSLRDDWFLASLPADMEPVFLEIPVDSTPGAAGFRTPSYLKALDFKLSWFYEIIRTHRGEIVCFSDLDVQFFGSFQSAVLEVMKQGYDVAGMRESAHGGMNGGFFAVRCAPHVEAMWEEAAAADKCEAFLPDQDTLNAFLEAGAHGVTYTLLPDAFWASHRHLMFKEPEPTTMLVHHATWGDKTGELQRVRDKFGLRSQISSA